MVGRTGRWTRGGRNARGGCEAGGRRGDGLELDELGPWVWTREDVFRFEGRLYHQRERYFLANVPAFDPRPTVINAEEAKTFDGLRWWTLGELETTDERFAPAELPALVRELVEEGPPERPIAVGV